MRPSRSDAWRGNKNKNFSVPRCPPSRCNWQARGHGHVTTSDFFGVSTSMWLNDNSVFNTDRTSGITFKIKSTINQRRLGLQNDLLIFLFSGRSLKNNNLCCLLFLMQHNASCFFIYLNVVTIHYYSFSHKKETGRNRDIDCWKWKRYIFCQILQRKENLAAVINTAINLQCCKITTRERYYCI